MSCFQPQGVLTHWPAAPRMCGGSPSLTPGEPPGLRSPSEPGRRVWLRELCLPLSAVVWAQPTPIQETSDTSILPEGRDHGPQGALPAKTKGSLCLQESLPKPVFKVQAGGMSELLGGSPRRVRLKAPCWVGLQRKWGTTCGPEVRLGETACDWPAVS